MSEVNAVPSEDISWAGTQVDPGSPKKAAGWLSAEKPRHDFFNWILGAIATWVAWLLGRSTRKFDDLYSAIETLSVGDIFHLSPTSHTRLTQTAALLTGTGTQASAVTADGVYYYAYDDSDAEFYANRADTQANVWNEAPGTVGSPIGVTTDGEIVALRFPYDAVAREISVHDCATGTQLVGINTASGTTGQIFAASSNGKQRLYYTEAQYIRLWDDVSGIQDMVNSPGTVFLAVCVSDDYIHTIAQDSGDVTYAVYPITGGTALNTLVLKASTVGLRAVITTDGEHCYAAVYFSGAVAEFYSFGAYGFGTGKRWEIAPSGLGTGNPQVPSIEVDDRYVYVIAANGYLLVLNKVSGCMRFADLNAAQCVAIDGVYIYSTRSGDPEVYRHGTGRTEGLWQVVGQEGSNSNQPDGTARRPFYKRAIPL